MKLLHRVETVALANYTCSVVWSLQILCTAALALYSTSPESMHTSPLYVLYHLSLAAAIITSCVRCCAHFNIISYLSVCSVKLLAGGHSCYE